MTPNEISDAAKLILAKSAKTADDAMLAWGRVCDKIEARALATRPKPRSFEVHHETQVARLAFLTALVAGGDLSTCETAALAAVAL